MRVEQVYKVKSVKFNFIMNSILTGTSLLFPMISYPYVTRRLEPAGVGAVSFANAVVTYFMMFAQMGVPTYGIRICAEKRENREELSRGVQEILILNLITCLISYVVFLIMMMAVPDMQKEKLLFLVMGGSIILNTLGVEWLYKGLEQYTYITVRSVFCKAVALVGIFLFIHDRSDYVVYGFLSTFALLGSNLLNFVNLRNIIDIRPVGNYHLRKHIKPILIFFGMSVATTVYTNMDSVMLGFISGAKENGYYDVAVKVKNILVCMIVSMGAVLLPRVSHYWSSGARDKFWHMAERAIGCVLAFVCPLCVFFMIYARPVIYMLSGSLYGDTVLPMQIIMPSILLIGITNITGIQILVPSGREKYVFYSEIVGAVVNVSVNAFLIPDYGAKGAAVGTVMAELSVLMVQLYVLREVINTLFYKEAIKKILLAVLIAGMAGIWINRSGLNLYLTIFLGGIVFWGIYISLLILLKEKMIFELWKHFIIQIRR